MSQSRKVSVSEENYEELKRISKDRKLSITFILNRLIEDFIMSKKGISLVISSSPEEPKKNFMDRYMDKNNATS